jgi:D5 N terminal like
MKTLSDCLRPKSKQEYSDSNASGGTSTTASTIMDRLGELNIKQINAVCAILGPYYKKRFRNTICLALSGVLRKSNISKDSALEIIQQLARNDEEAKQRAAVVESTYAKGNVWDVCGIKYFLCILKSASGSNIDADQILSTILVILAGKKDVITWLTEIIMNNYIFKTMRDTEEIYYYEKNNGLYVLDGSRLIQESCQLLYPKISTHEVHEVVNQINRRTGVDRSKFDSNIDIINLENGLLNIHTLEFREHSPNEFSLVQLPLVYNPKANCPAYT